MTLVYDRSNGGLMAKSGSVSVRFPAELLERMDLACAGRSRSQFVLDAVRAALDESVPVRAVAGAEATAVVRELPQRAPAPAKPARPEGQGVRWAVTRSPSLERFGDDVRR